MRKQRRGSPGRSSPEAHCVAGDCDRPIYVGGHCQTHYRQLRATGELKPIRLYRTRTEGTVKLGGLRLTPACAAELQREAEAKGLSISAVIVDILEGWHAGGR